MTSRSGSERPHGANGGHERGRSAAWVLEAREAMAQPPAQAWSSWGEVIDIDRGFSVASWAPPGSQGEVGHYSLACRRAGAPRGRPREGRGGVRAVGVDIAPRAM
jgi:hypothetical protein